MSKIKIPSPIRRDDGRYMIRYTENGKRKCIYGKTAFEVKSKYSQMIIRKNQETKEFTGTLSDCIYDWLINFKFGKIKNSSYDRLESTYINHIKDDPIGKMEVHEIKSIDIQKYIDRKAFPDDKKKLLSMSSLKKIKELLAGFFKFAYEQNMITFNPMLAITLPLNENMEKKTKVTEEIPSTVINALYEDCNMRRRYNTAFVILLNTGLRIGELIALKWEDINFKNNTIRVNKTISINKKRDGKKVLKGIDRIEGSTKTFCGNRVIPMNEKVLSCLRMIQEENARLGIIAENVISTTNGTPASARNIQRAFDSWLCSRNFKHYNLHALRHTFGSILIRNKVDVKVVSELLGHSNVQTTYNIYIHIIKEQKIQAINTLNQII